MAVFEPARPAGQALEPTSDVEITAISGNGRLLAGFAHTGSLRTLTAPNLDYPQHLRSSRLAIRRAPDEPPLWLETDAWRHDQTYLDGGDIVVTRSSRDRGQTTVEQRATVLDDVVLIGIKGAIRGRPESAFATFEFAFQVGGQALANGLEYSPADGHLLAYHRRHALAFRLLPSLASLRVDSLGSVGGGKTNGTEALMTAGEVSATLTGELQSMLLLMIAWGEPDTAGTKLTELAARLGTVTSWPSELDPPARSEGITARGPLSDALRQISPVAYDAYERSLITIRQLTDRSGAILAGPPIDADFRGSGGYAFCWPRDGGFIAYALDTAGGRHEARAFFDWALQVQPSDGIWKQRYYADGALAPSWAEHQLDGVGTVLWALDRHLEGSDDRELAARGLEAAVRSYAEVNRLATTEGWPPTTQNLWEDQGGAHLYTAASLLAGARAWRRRAHAAGNREGARLLSHIQGALEQALAEWPVDARTGALARTVSRRGGREKATLDFTPDGSLLGLSVPFECLPVDDARLRATVDAIKKELRFPSGRLARYAGDRYRGGNAWPLITLWLALHEMRAGNRGEAARLYRHVLDDRTPAGLLSEQVDPKTGRACWVVPLAWAHAWLLLVSQALLAEDAFKPPLVHPGDPH